MTETKVLLVGESWATSATHYKGFDQFGSVTFHLGAEPLVAALRDSPFKLTYMPAHETAEGFPFTAEGLAQYDVILLSDIGANTLLLPPSVWLHGRPVPNRLKLIRDWTAKGGGLAMIGGYFSFQGIDGRARWRRTPVEEVLPVECLPYDDRIEVPEGFVAELAPGAEVLASLPASEGGHPLLVTGTHGEGRTLAWTSDVGPHWLPQPFVDWPGYAPLWRNMLGWLARRDA